MEDTRRTWPTETTKQGIHGLPGPPREYCGCWFGSFVELLTMGVGVSLTLSPALRTPPPIRLPCPAFAMMIGDMRAFAMSYCILSSPALLLATGLLYYNVIKIQSFFILICFLKTLL